MPFPLLASLALAAAPSAPAQGMQATVGPSPAPAGCAVSITVSNDQRSPSEIHFCTYRVFDAAGALVYEPPCPPIVVTLGGFGWSTQTWAQVDQAGAPVPPGAYWVEVTPSLGTGPVTWHRVAVGVGEAGLVFEGTAQQENALSGEHRHFYLCAPGDGGYPYLLLASLGGSSGTPTCGGLLPLDPGPLLAASLVPDAVFLHAQGVLARDGTSREPTFDVPSGEALVGLEVHAAYVVLDPAAPCVVRRVSEPYVLVIE